MKDAVNNVSHAPILGDLPRTSHLFPRQHGVERGRMYKGKGGDKGTSRFRCAWPDLFAYFLIVPELRPASVFYLPGHLVRVRFNTKKVCADYLWIYGVVRQ